MDLKCHNISHDVYDEFKMILESATKESDVVPFIKNNLYLLRKISDSWNIIYGVSEFSLGGNYKADFMLLSADSGQWYVRLIEAESPTCKFFTKSGLEAKGLREARRQFSDWRSWLESNMQSFRLSISDIVESNCPANFNLSQHRLAKTQLRDIKTVVHIGYTAIIGRSSYRSESVNQKLSNIRDFKIITYDRLLDYAKTLEGCQTPNSKLHERLNYSCNFSVI